MNEVKSSEECRACLRKIDDGVRQELFQPWYTPWALAGALIADDLAKLADVEITEFDKHSKVICPQCFHCLSDACSFLITVQTSDCILRKRFENTITVNKVTEAGTSWPQPIQVNKNLNGNIEDSIEVEIKKEVLSEDENGSDHNMDQDWEPTMDIKIEPEEIVAPVPSNIQENGACSLMETNEEVVQQSSTSNSCEEYLDTTIKEEPLSDDEHEVAPDLPLDCLLCMKAFNSVTGLKAHVIAQHSYGTVKRKADNDPLPVTKEITNEFACAICRKSFVTRTDLMVHEAEHGKHACFVCDAKFNSFRQLSLHVARCRPRNVPSSEPARPPIRPQQLSQSNNDPSAVEIKVEPQIGPSIEESQMEPVKKQRKLEPSIEENKVEYVQRQSKCVPSIDETEVELVQKQPNTETSIKHTKEESVQKHSKTGTSIEDSTVATVIKQPKLDPSIEETKVESDHKQSKNGKTIEETNVKPLQKESGNGHSIVEIQVEPIGKEFKNGLSFAETEVEPTQKQSNDGHSIEEMEPVENEFKNGLSVAQTEADPVQKQSNNGTSIVEIEVETVEKQFENGPSIVERGPDQNQSNNGPSTEESKMESVQEQSNNGHSIEETKVEPVQKQSNISHSIEESKVEPVQKQSNNGHSIEEIKVEPVQEQSNNGHSIEETKVEPVQEQSNNEPSKEETNVESVQKQSKIRPSIEETKDELVQTQSEIETSTTENAFEKQPKNEPSTEENKVEPSQDHHISPDQITEDQLKTIIPVSESITSDTLQNQIVNEHKSSDCESKTSELVSDELNNSFDSLQSSQDVLDKIFLNTPHKEHLPIESRHRIESELCLEEHTNRDNFSSTQNDDGNLNTPEETIPNKDEINQSMKVHFAINPLSEDPELLEHKMDIDIESGKSDGCEPNVVNMTGDNSVTQ